MFCFPRYLAQDKMTGLCVGFAFVNYKSKTAAGNAIQHLNGSTFEDMTLSVDWTDTSKP